MNSLKRVYQVNYIVLFSNIFASILNFFHKKGFQGRFNIESKKILNPGFWASTLTFFIVVKNAYHKIWHHHFNYVDFYKHIAEARVVKIMAVYSKDHRLERIKVFRLKIPSKNLKEASTQFTQWQTGKTLNHNVRCGFNERE